MMTYRISLRGKTSRGRSSDHWSLKPDERAGELMEDVGLLDVELLA
jgi:hypothetical protein